MPSAARTRTKPIGSAVGLVTVIALLCAISRAEDKPASQPATTQASTATFEASDFDGLKAAVDKTVTVHGTISRAGWYQDRILFINFEGVDRAGFAAIVRKDHKDAVANFGEGGADL